MRVKVLSTYGYLEALFGVGLSRGLTSEISFSKFVEDIPLQERLTNVALDLAPKDCGHNKFLEAIIISVIVEAPRFWWQEMATYRVGTVTQSESTMYTISKRELLECDFEYPLPKDILNRVNSLIKNKDNLTQIKNALPEGFLQKRVITMSFKTYLNIHRQRNNHKLPQWRYFLDDVYIQLPSYLQKIVDVYSNAVS